MSSQTIVDFAGNKKIYDDLLPNPYPYPAQPPSLAQVLIAGDDAANGNIENLLQLQVTNVVQQDQIGGHLVIGGTPSNPGSGGDLRIQGATTKGSLLVGNGTSTAEFAVPAPPPPNGSVLILDSTQPLGVRWGGESGPINTISAGNNIDIGGTSANPIVAFQSPTTSNILIGVGTEIQAKDNYGSPNFAMTLDATGFNDKYDVGGVVNQEDIAVSSTSVQQILSTTNTSDYINSATLTCDTNFISDTRTSQILSAGLEKTASASITTNVSSSLPLAGFSCGVSAPTTFPFPDITASISMNCPDTTNPNFSLSQSAPFAISYSTIIDKDGINSNNTGGVAPLTINSNTQPLALTTTDNITFSADNIDLSSTGRLIVPSLSSGDFMDYNTGSLKIVNDSVGGTANPLLVLQNNNATAGGVVVETYKNDPPTATGGDVISALSSYTNALVVGVATKVEMTRISSIAQGVGTNNNDGSIVIACKVNSSLAPQNFLIANGGIGTGEVQVLKPLDMTGNSIKTSSGDLNITSVASTGTGNLNVQAKGSSQFGGETGFTNLYNTNGNITLNAGGVASDLEFNCPNWESATAGGNSGQHLRIKLNGVYYKIKLENDV